MINDCVKYTQTASTDLFSVRPNMFIISMRRRIHDVKGVYACFNITQKTQESLLYDISQLGHTWYLNFFAHV